MTAQNDLDRSRTVTLSKEVEIDGQFVEMHVWCAPAQCAAGFVKHVAPADKR